MKIRLGFVSNSSSSSFFVKLDRLSPIQKSLIQNKQSIIQLISTPELIKEYGEIDWFNAWNIIEIPEKDLVYWDCMMDNFNLIKLIEDLGFPKSSLAIYAQYDSEPEFDKLFKENEQKLRKEYKNG